MGEKENKKNEKTAGDPYDEVVNSALNSGLFVQVAEAYRLQGRYEEAMATCQTGLEKTPHSLAGRLLLGRCYLEKGMNTEAKEELERVAKEIEECLPVYTLLTQLYIHEKNLDQSLDAVRKALYFSSANEALNKRVTPLELGLLQREPTSSRESTPEDLPEKPVVESSQTMVSEPLKTAIQTDTLAEIYIKQGHWKKALSIYKEILDREPGNTAVREKIEALRKRIEGDPKAASKRKTISRLEKWLAVVRREEKQTSVRGF